MTAQEEACCASSRAVIDRPYNKDLLALNAEIAFYVVMSPSANDCAIVQSKILDFAVDNIMDVLTGGVFRIGFEMDRPTLGIERGIFQRNGTRTRIDRTCDLFSVPIHDDGHLVTVILIGTPIAEPRPLQGMSFLREGRKRQTQTNQEGNP